MQTLKSENSAPIRLFVEMFGEHLLADDYMEFYSNRRKGNFIGRRLDWVLHARCP